MIITHKTECFPDRDQIQKIEQCFGMRRFYFNKTIMTLKHKYGDLKENKKLITKKEVMSYRKDIFRTNYRELVDTTPSHILDTSIEDVQFALNSLWKKGREIKLRKKKDSNTCRWGNCGTTGSFRIDGNLIRIPKLGWLKLAERFRFENNLLENENRSIKTVTVKKQAGRYFVSITCEVKDKPRFTNRNKHLGIDWGIKTYITGYDGTDLVGADFCPVKLKKLDKRIARDQKSLSRKIRFSNNWLKAKIKLQQSYLDFDNYRLDFIKLVVNEIDKSYDSVTLEDLGMTFVTRNRKLAHKAKQKPFYLLKVALINKFHQTGKKVYLVPKNYPSTQTCNSCGYVKTKENGDKMKLGESIYNCPSCGKSHDRDENAAMNIYNYKNLEEASLDN